MKMFYILAATAAFAFFLSVAPVAAFDGPVAPGACLPAACAPAAPMACAPAVAACAPACSSCGAASEGVFAGKPVRHCLKRIAHRIRHPFKRAACA